ncbi:LPXTG cell wall anchor domain-containing protein [Enterococcus faecalis]|uniref:LPXTG cell wall anchor domain-containing protein n=1 Tax=Enterococcus faecalis TaxID=1351 RepID=UPI0025B229AB|nr:LPXTG cell wall anchor domain-containing protein [Enterococcus faecalis]MDN3202053.1 LPXTG cell wall anchor domain-containing protein [Enterococcus faecalis]
MKKRKRIIHTLLSKAGKGLGIVALASSMLLGIGSNKMTEAHALSLPSGNTQIGKIDGVPVIKAGTKDMSSSAFQELVDAVVTDSDAQYVVNKAYWGANTQLANGTPLANMPTGQSFWLKADGFTNADHYVQLNKNGKALIRSVGYATDLSTGKQIPLDLGVIYRDSQTSNGSGTANKIYMAAKSQNGVITLGWVAPADDGSTDTGGSSEGGSTGSGSRDGAMASYVNDVVFAMTLINADTGQPLPAEKTIMALKLSDIDALQRATLDSNGVKAILLSPDTKLAIDGQGMVATSTDAVNADSKYLSALSYITIRQFNTARTQYTYTGNEWDKHCDIVVGAFGQYPFEINLKGKIEIEKETKEFGKKPWNDRYSFDPIQFDIIDKSGKVVGELDLQKDGKDLSDDLPKGEYTLREKSSNWAATGQTKHPDIKVTVEAGKTVKINVTNTAVKGQITIKKTGVESGTEMWNSHYSLKGNEFKLTSKTDEKTYTIVSDAQGIAKKGDLPLGRYLVEETKASPGFANTFKPVEVELAYKNNTTELVYGDAKGTNQEIKGENLLQKVDNMTELEQNGKANMKEAKYQLFYNDESTGSSPHKIDDPVKWTDTPAPKLLKGEKATEAMIGGKLVNFGEAVVVDVDDDSLQASVGNLPIGKFYWKEVDAGEGYVVDPKKHTFEIKKFDDQTTVIQTPDARSEEQVIKAKITLDKSLTLPNNQGGSGFNFIEFTASPLEGTNADKVLFKTGVHPVTGEDGYAENMLVYGDWVLEETKGQEGYEDVAPIYIHMETDKKKDRLTISASYHKDFSKPFSKRIFTLRDSASEGNPNNEGAVGEVSSDVPTISLSTIRFNDHPVIPKDPEKPSKDVTKVDGGESINGGNVALDSNFVYVLNSSIQQANREEIAQWLIHDDYDETKDRYNGTFKVYATTDFGTYKKGQELPNEWIKAEDKEGKVLFTAQKELLDVVNATKDQPVGFSIHADFYRYKASENVVNIFDETVNDTTEKSNEVHTKTPNPQPHKFDLSEEKVDLTGNRLLDNDEELEDRYTETNKNPYVDDTTNNDKENINTQNVHVGQSLIYQLWLDATPFDDTSKLSMLSMVDTYDKNALAINLDAIHVYNKKGKDVTKFFKVTEEKGQLKIAANAFVESKHTNGETVKIIDTKKIPMNQVYKIDVPMTVKKEVKPGTDIINTAGQFWADITHVEDSHVTEKRVNKVQESKDPIKDVTKTNGGKSIHGGNVALYSNFVYELTSSIQPTNREDLSIWTILDDYDETFDCFNGTFKVYATTDFGEYKKDQGLPNEWFKVTEKEGKVLFSAQKAFLDVVNANKTQSVGFSIRADFYRHKASEKVNNVFDETVNETKKKSNVVYTKTANPQPHKFDLSKEQVDLTGQKLLDDDSELKDRYAETNKDPYVDQVENNEKENINTQTVVSGQTLVYQLWLDTRPFDSTSQLQTLSMVDTYDSELVSADLKAIKVYDAKGKDVTKQFTITDKKGTLTIAANAFVEAKNSKGEAVKIIDTKKVSFGQIYKIDVPMTVKKEVKAGKDIVNTARQESMDSTAIKQSQQTEKRVNKVKEPIKGILPHTGDTPTSFLVKIAGWVMVIGVTFWKREAIQRQFRKLRLKIMK